MTKVFKLWRGPSTPNGTAGVLTLDGKTICYTFELPWRDNAQQISSIPEGSYPVVRHGWEPESTVRFKRSWRLLDVPGRSAILIHAGNTVKDTLGCILVGMSPITNGVGRSQEAMNMLRDKLPETFILEIESR